MDLIENVQLLLEANKNYKNDIKNNSLREARDRLKYYLLVAIQNSPEKSFILKNYLEEKIFNSRERQTLEKEDYIYIKLLYKEVEVIYIESLKDLTLNQKRVFFERQRNNSLNKRKNKEKVYAYA